MCFWWRFLLGIKGLEVIFDFFFIRLSVEIIMFKLKLFHVM